MKLPRYMVSDHRNGHGTLIRERGAMSTGIGTFLLQTAEMLATNLNAEMAEAETWQRGAAPQKSEFDQLMDQQQAIRAQQRDDMREEMAAAIHVRHLNIIDALLPGKPAILPSIADDSFKEATIKHLIGLLGAVAVDNQAAKS